MSHVQACSCIKSILFYIINIELCKHGVSEDYFVLFVLGYFFIENNS